MEKNAETSGWIVWGSELSPFALKLLLCMRHAGWPHRFLPTQGSLAENLKILRRLQALKKGRLPLTWPRMTEDDELPLVPYAFGPDGENLYDSSAIAEWMDRHLPPERRMIPAAPLAAFVARLIDDYADEFLLYAVHHQRWKVSAVDNDAGRRLAREFRHLLGPLQPVMAHTFSARQTRRLPYLFSVAPQGYHIPGLPRRRQPPARAGFPPTHALLEAAFDRLCDILETLLAQRPFVLGSRFTLADAALYGQLGMNLSDPTTAERLRVRTPRLFQWLQALHQGRPAATTGAAAPLRIDADLQPLLAEIGRIHLPLMRQNAAAYANSRAQSARLFNEAAFDRGLALYDGVLDGQPYRSVAKSFQARVWRDCQIRWQALSAAERDCIAGLMPGTADFAHMGEATALHGNGA